MNDIDRIEQLISEQNFIGQKGALVFNYAGLQATVFSKDVLGNTIQDWFGQWLKSHSMVWKTGVHSQTWPDFILNDGSHLEVKTFDGDASPNFDLANFDAFVRSLWAGDVHRLDTIHLVFSYVVDDLTGSVTITDYWFKNMWELTGPSQTNILNLQVKQNKAVNIRPKNWRSNRVQLFESRRQFVYALSKAVERFSPDAYPDWYGVVERHYLRTTGGEL